MLRKTFDALLSEAWRRSARGPEDYAEYHHARLRRRILPAEIWQNGHDLMGESIWKTGYLDASLDDVPLT